MIRKEMIKVLQAIRDNKLSIENFWSPQVYFFDQISDNPPSYEMNGKKFSETEYKDFCDKIRSRNNNSIIWNEGKKHPKDDIIITAVPAKGCDPLKVNGGTFLVNAKQVTMH